MNFLRSVDSSVVEFIYRRRGFGYGVIFRHGGSSKFHS